MEFNYDYSQTEFVRAYDNIKNTLIDKKAGRNNKCACFLGAQPGAGKSSYYSAHTHELEDYIIIDGDEFRRHHPRYDEIMAYDPEEYAERTQSFLSTINEKLITELSDDGYNLVIEGTLRNPNVVINTNRMLKSKNYKPNLIVVGCDATVSWKSTIKRANEYLKAGEAPRLVPFDKYDSIVSALEDNLKVIAESNTFSEISIVGRDGEDLYNGTNPTEIVQTLHKELNIEKWKTNKAAFEQEYLDAKIQILRTLKEFRMKIQ